MQTMAASPKILHDLLAMLTSDLLALSSLEQIDRYWANDANQPGMDIIDVYETRREEFARFIRSFAPSVLHPAKSRELLAQAPFEIQLIFHAHCDDLTSVLQHSQAETIEVPANLTELIYWLFTMILGKEYLPRFSAGYPPLRLVPSRPRNKS